MKKSLLSLLLVLTMLFNAVAMTACGNKDNDDDDSSNSDTGSSNNNNNGGNNDDDNNGEGNNDDNTDGDDNDNENTENEDSTTGTDEIILLVDTSYTAKDSQDKINEFIQSVISANEDARLGIVTFGYDQIYAAELSCDMNEVYSKYIKAPKPNDSATNIADALTYASGLFVNPLRAKIVLISDGAQTDGDALSAVKAVTSKGIIVDTMSVDSTKVENEVKIVGVSKPDAIKTGEKTHITVSVESSYTGNITLTLLDNGVRANSMDVNVSKGLNKIRVPYTFVIPGLHVLQIDISDVNDTLAINNTYFSYMNFEGADKILVIESIKDESEALIGMIGSDFNVSVVHVKDIENMPSTVKELREFHQVILCNVSFSDMPEGFEEILYDYVTNIGGGLFTVCGNKDDGNPYDDSWEANAFTREDVMPSQYLKKLLPVDIINYTPPTAVIVLIDKSGSMYYEEWDADFEHSKLSYALRGAEACLDCLSERDYIGVYPLADYGEEALELTPAIERTKILNVIHNIGRDGGGTVFSTAIAAAGRTLKAQTNVENKHIIIITDGEPDPTDVDRTKGAMLDNAAAGITTSIIGIQASGDAQVLMKQLLVEFAGVEEKNFHNVTVNDSVLQAVRDDMGAPEITDVNYVTFQPTFGTTHIITSNIDETELPTLDGYYGVKAKEGSTVILNGEYTPIYTQWQFGKGKVGTFACDLNGTWSSNFINSEVGATVVKNIVKDLMPYQSIRFTDVELDCVDNNYTTQVNVYTELFDGEYLEATVTYLSSNGTIKVIKHFTAGQDERYWRFEFEATELGVYHVLVQKKDANGNLLTFGTLYKSLSYSKEYDALYDAESALALLDGIREAGNGNAVKTPEDVFVFNSSENNDETENEEESKYKFNVSILDVRVSKVNGLYNVEVDIVSYGRSKKVTLCTEVFEYENYCSEKVLYLHEGEVTTVLAVGLNPDDFKNSNEYITAYREKYGNLADIWHLDGIRCYIAEDDEYNDDNFFELNRQDFPTINILYVSDDHENSEFTYFETDEWKNSFFSCMEFFTYTPGSNEKIPTSGYDIYIYEKYIPEVLPTDGVCIIVNPCEAYPSSGFSLGTEAHFLTGTTISRQEDHPLLKGIEFGTIQKFTKTFNVDPRYQPLLYWGSNPIAYATENSDDYAKVVLINFQLDGYTVGSLYRMIFNIVEYYDVIENRVELDWNIA